MKNDDEHLNNIRHSCAHLLAAAVLDLFPGAQNAIGPAIENGFYQDFDLGAVKISEDDLPQIEKKMQELLQAWSAFETKEVSIEQARKDFAWNQYKLELAEEFAKEGKKITENNPGNFLDLCKGGHSENPQEKLKYFKLLSIAGAYWRGSEKNKMLTRIYGTCFPTQKGLDEYLNMLEEAKKRDHRKLGKELDLFVISDLVGAGLPMFTPKGTILRDELLRFSENLQLKAGYQKIWTPHITKTDLYKKSGHWDKFGEELFLVQSQQTEDQFVLKPMNCPHTVQIYASKIRSYRELPLRYMETGTVYRDEKTGEMLGISRVRSITQDDAHIFCRMDQIGEEFKKIMDMVSTMYQALGMKFKARLSFRDSSNKFLGETKDWQKAQQILKKVADDLKLDYFIAEGEAAFYGPKIDILVTDSLGREWQCATEQLDFVQPQRFGLKYTDADGSTKTPFMIHKAILGSIERFLSVYIEHTGGAFPVWLAPVQSIIIPITDRQNQYAQNVTDQLKGQNIRADLDDRSETMQAKIRDSQLAKIPYMIILGDREEKAGQVAVRTREGKDLGQMTIEEFKSRILREIAKKA